MNDQISAWWQREERASLALHAMASHRVLLALLCTMVVTPAQVAHAQASPNVASATGAPTKKVCVDAEVDGVRALSYDCLSQQLAPTAIAGSAGAAPNAAEALATGPSNRVGTFNYSAESNRFGANWGKSVFPQRPAPVPVVPIQH